MKHTLWIAALGLLLGVNILHAGITDNAKSDVIKAKFGNRMVTYKSIHNPLFLDPATGDLNYYFKLASFKADLKEDDELLAEAMQAASFQLVEFKGRLIAPLKVNEGQTVSTFAIGQVTFGGLTSTIKVPVMATRKNGKLNCLFTTELDPQRRPSLRSGATKSSLITPLQLTQEHTL